MRGKSVCLFVCQLELGLIDSNRFGKANRTRAYLDSTRQFREVLKPSSVDKLEFLRAIDGANCMRAFSLHTTFD